MTAATVKQALGLATLALVITAFLFGPDLPPWPAPPQPDRAATERRAAWQAERERREAVVAGLAIRDFSWRAGPVGVMTITLTIANPSDYDVKDIALRCEHTAPSGTMIDSNTRTIYEIVPARGARTFRDFNMGFIHSQAHRSGCVIRDAVVGAHRPAPRAKTPAPSAARPAPPAGRAEVEKRRISDNPK